MARCTTKDQSAMRCTEDVMSAYGAGHISTLYNICIMSISMSYDNLPAINNTRFDAKREPQVKVCTELHVSKRYIMTHHCSILQEQSHTHLLPFQAGHKAVRSAIIFHTISNLTHHLSILSAPRHLLYSPTSIPPLRIHLRLLPQGNIPSFYLLRKCGPQHNQMSLFTRLITLQLLFDHGFVAFNFMLLQPD